jgi:hypothetical protein
LPLTFLKVAQLPVADVAAAAPAPQAVRHARTSATKTPRKRLFQGKDIAQKASSPVPKQKIVVLPSAKKPVASRTKPSSVAAPGQKKSKTKPEPRTLPTRAVKNKSKSVISLTSDSEYEEEDIAEESSATASSEDAEGGEDLGADSADEQDALADAEDVGSVLSGDFVEDDDLMDTDNVRDEEEEELTEEPLTKRIRVTIEQPSRSASAPKSTQKSAKKPVTTPVRTTLPPIIYGQNLGPGFTEKRRLAAIAQKQAELEQLYAQSPLSGKKRTRPMTEQEKFDEETI